MDLAKPIRQSAANAANAEDADIWRWFADLVEERRIRWCFANGSWLVSIDNRHVATDENFDHAIRTARRRSPRGDEKANRNF
ncbi:hypothetical protein [Paraburkholderia aspalathi]|uniref:hypothetical protein n=1 Tax=Paraburkholderia aspalathi TaxID=1324617 RepID=UPI003C8263B2